MVMQTARRSGWTCVKDDGEHCGDSAREIGPGGAAGAAMIPIRSDVWVWLASGHTDMRKGMGGLAPGRAGSGSVCRGRVRVSGGAVVR